MAWREDYTDPFPRECEHGMPDGINCDDCNDDGDDWECAYPGECLMSYTDHMRCECHTVEDMEEMGR